MHFCMATSVTASEVEKSPLEALREWWEELEGTKKPIRQAQRISLFLVSRRNYSFLPDEII